MKFRENVVLKRQRKVAPLAGAWIEIQNREQGRSKETVAPLAGAWIEIAWDHQQECLEKSLPSRERGLKLEVRLYERGATESLPSRERGLKFQEQVASLQDENVAPLAGAWIEIYSLKLRSTRSPGRSPRGSVD